MKTKLLLPLLSLTLGALPLLAELKYFPKDKDELLKLVKNEKIKLDEIDTSKITDMSYLFCKSDWDECKNSAKKRKSFKGIEKWNVSNVKNMEGMFANALFFNQPLNQWDVSKVVNMKSMFAGTTSFNQPLDKWDVSNVKYMQEMFIGTESFNQPLNSWNMKNVENISSMFMFAQSFNQPLDQWDVSNVVDMSCLFCGAKLFNQPLEKWNVAKVKKMIGMFALTQNFNQPLNSWDVSNVIDMGAMFRNAKAFNQPLDSWKLNTQVNTELMFDNAKAFKQDLSSWGEKNPLKVSTPPPPKKKESSLFDKAFALIGVDEDKATQLFLQSLNSKEEKSQEAKLYLAYLYLNNPNGDKKEANRLANEYVDSLRKDCTQDNDSNFCRDYAKPSEFQKVEDIFDVIFFADKCFAYGMIPSHPSIFQYMGMYYGSNRDNFLGSFCGDVPPPYQVISVSPILNAENFPKLLELLEAKIYSAQGSMRFGIGADRRKNQLIYSFFPKFDIHSSSKWEFYGEDEPEYWYFGWFKMVINQYPDLLEAYNQCVKNAQEYYINVLKIEKQTALEYGKKAVELLVLQDLLYYTI